MGSFLTASETHNLSMSLLGTANFWTSFVEWWESFAFLRVFFSPTVAIETFPTIVQGFPITLMLGFVGFALAIPFGLALSFMKMSRYGVEILQMWQLMEQFGSTGLSGEIPGVQCL